MLFVVFAAHTNKHLVYQVSAAVEFVNLTHPHPKVPSALRQQAEDALRRLDAWETCQSFSRKVARSV